MLSAPSVRPYEANRIELTLELSFATFTGAFEALLGKMDLEALSDLPTLSPEAARAKLGSFVGPLELSIFQKFDHGALLTVFTGRRVRAMTYVFGNALIAIEMTQHDARAGLYVPLRLFVQEIATGRVKITYEQPSRLLAQLGSPDIDVVARGLDAKVERVLREVVKRAGEHSRILAV